jgi:hypothetical protein
LAARPRFFFGSGSTESSSATATVARPLFLATGFAGSMFSDCCSSTRLPRRPFGAADSSSSSFFAFARPRLGAGSAIASCVVVSFFALPRPRFGTGSSISSTVVSLARPRPRLGGSSCAGSSVLKATRLPRAGFGSGSGSGSVVFALPRVEDLVDASVDFLLAAALVARALGFGSSSVAASSMTSCGSSTMSTAALRPRFLAGAGFSATSNFASVALVERPRFFGSGTASVSVSTTQS